MKALSLYQPWASIVAEGFKTIENRSQMRGFSTPFPQRIALHASKTYDPTAGLRIMKIAKDTRNHDLLRRIKAFQYNETRVPMGAIIGVCELTDAGPPDEIRAKYPEDAIWIFDDAEWCYVVRNAVRFAKAIPFRGMQGFFEVPDDLVAWAFEDWPK